MSLFSVTYGGLVAHPPIPVDSRDWGGQLHATYAVYAPGVAIVNGWEIRMARVPAGARIRGGMIEITAPFGAATTTAHIGWRAAGHESVLFSHFPLTTAGQTVLDREIRGVGRFVPVRFGTGVNATVPQDTDTDLIMTVTAVTTPTTNGRLLIYLDYVF